MRDYLLSGHASKGCLRFIGVERSILVVAGPFPERAEQRQAFMALCFLIVDVMQPAAPSSCSITTQL